VQQGVNVVAPESGLHPLEDLYRINATTALWAYSLDDVIQEELLAVSSHLDRDRAVLQVPAAAAAVALIHGLPLPLPT